jgi:hypothetical protein
MTISWPNNTTDIINTIRNTIGRDITILVTVSGTPCPICDLNPVSNLSTDPFCPVCSGTYWLNTTSGYIVKAHVAVGRIDLPWRVAGGYLEKGEATVQIEYTDENIIAVQNAIHYEIDDKIYTENGISLRGVPTINRIVITLTEQEG